MPKSMSMSKSKSKSKSGRRVISFQLPKEVFEVLQQDVALRGTKSLHQRCRDIVVNHYLEDSAHELQEQLSAIESDVTWLGQLVRRVAYAVIVHAAGKEIKEANSWIREHMPITKDTQP